MSQCFLSDSKVKCDSESSPTLHSSLQIFEQVLSELEPLCLAEQDFIIKFFKLQQQVPLAQVCVCVCVCVYVCFECVFV